MIADTRTAERRAERLQIGQNIRRLRAKCGISQSELAHSIGVQQSIVSTMETGMGDVSARRLARLSSALGCDASEILEGVPL